MSLRAQLTFWYTALLGVPLVAFALGSYFLVERALLSETDRFMGDAVAAVSREAAAERRAGTEEAIRTTVEEVRFRDLGITITDRAGRVVAATDSAASGAGVRTLERPLELGGETYVVRAAYPLSDIDRVLSRIGRVYVVAVPMLILVSALGGHVLAGRSLREREEAFARQRRFMADASHELRTPTAILRTEADVTLSQEHRTEAEYRASFGVIRDAAQRLTRVVDDLFLLARADAGNLDAQRAPLYLEEVVHDATRAVRPLADRRGVTVAVVHAVDAPFSGDADLLGRVFLNLLDNAIRHSPGGGTVEVRMARADGAYQVDVADAGGGVPAELRERIFERFYRADKARARTDDSLMGGAGLGLPIARRVAELHGGRLELIESTPGRTVFRVELPVGGRSAPA